MLTAISFTIELCALLMAIGLGLYLVTRSVHRPEAWLAAFTCWSMGGLFVNMLLALIPPPLPGWMSVLLLFWPEGIFQQESSAWLRGWTATLSPAFWYHATLLMRPGPLKARHKYAIAGVYLLALVGIAIQAWLPQYYQLVSGNPLLLNSLQGGIIYGIFLTTLALLCGLSIRNLALAARLEPRHLPRRQLLMLSAATALGGMTGPLGLLAAFLDIPVPMYLIAVLIGAGVVVTGFGVARYSALMENRIFQRDFFYTFWANFATVVVYLTITWGFNQFFPFPPSIYIFMGILAVVSHSLVDVARHNVDFFFYQQEKRLLRERLRSLDSQDEASLLQGLTRLLENICEPLQASYAILLVRQNEHFEQVAEYHFRQAGLKLAEALVSADDLKYLQPGELPEALAGAVLLIPIYLGDQQAGALVFGAAEHGLAYSPVELDGLQEFCDYLGGWLRHLILQRSLPVEQLKAQFTPEAGLLINLSAEISPRTVELGLRSLHDYPRLAELPLASLNVVRQRCASHATHLEIGEAVHSLLCETVEQLRPLSGVPGKGSRSAPRRDWYPYLILHDAYVDCQPNREIMDRLYISEGTFNRTRRSAIRSLTNLLVTLENQAG